MSETLREVGEKRLLRMLQKYHGKTGSVVRTFSEDCAIIDTGDANYQLFTIDTLAEGVHFRRDYMPSFYLGRKAIKVNVSDISAMGGKPLFYLVSLGAPPELPTRTIEDIYDGFASVSDELGVQLIGGNVTSSPVLFLDVVVIGSVSKDEVLMRNGAREGDAIFLSGRLGASAEGLQLLQDGFRLLGDSLILPERQRDSSFVREAILSHIDPSCENAVARKLAGWRLVRSMIDLSDGLAGDLAEICRESGVGAEVALSRLPIAPAALHWERKRKKDPVLLALQGGEDYHLLFTVGQKEKKQFLAHAKKENFIFFEIGKIVNASNGIYLLDDEGNRREIGSGYQHF